MKFEWAQKLTRKHWRHVALISCYRSFLNFLRFIKDFFSKMCFFFVKNASKKYQESPNGHIILISNQQFPFSKQNNEVNTGKFDIHIIIINILACCAIELITQWLTTFTHPSCNNVCVHIIIITATDTEVHSVNKTKKFLFEDVKKGRSFFLRRESNSSTPQGIFKIELTQTYKSYNARSI